MDPGRRQRIHDWTLRFADGDRAAFQPLFDALWPLLFEISFKGLGDAAAAEDAAQQAMIKTFSRIAEFDRSRDGVSWVVGILAFEVMTIRKQRARRREVDVAALDSMPDERAGAEEQTAADQIHSAVVAVVGKLSERDQAALASVLASDAPPKEERSRKQRFRALERLRAAWRRAHG